jgi:hypothetical protein
MGMREEYQALIEKQLNDWKQQMESLKAGAEMMQAHTKAQFEFGLKLLQARQAEAWENFQKLKQANEGSWADFRTHMDKAGEEIKSAYVTLMSRFKP